MRGTVRWQITAEGLKHAAPPWVDLWPCSSPCFPPFTCSAHSSCSFQRVPSLCAALTAEKVLYVLLHAMQHREAIREKANKQHMMKTPCLVTRSAGPPHLQGPNYERGLFSKLYFPCAILGVWGYLVLFLRGVKPWQGLPESPGCRRVALPSAG